MDSVEDERGGDKTKKSRKREPFIEGEKWVLDFGVVLTYKLPIPIEELAKTV